MNLTSMVRWIYSPLSIDALFEKKKDVICLAQQSPSLLLSYSEELNGQKRRENTSIYFPFCNSIFFYGLAGFSFTIQEKSVSSNLNANWYFS